jgi:AraC-like DNA-binding protein
MIFQTSTIASILPMVIEAMDKNYNFDARPLISNLGIDLSRIEVPGARYPTAMMIDLSHSLLEKTGDDCIGLAIGSHVRPTTFYALGYAWLASATLLGAFKRLARYDQIVSTADVVTVAPGNNTYSLVFTHRSAGIEARPIGIDCFFMALISMCRWIGDPSTAPVEVHLQHDSAGRDGDYVTAFGAPVVFEAEQNCLIFDRDTAERPVSGSNTGLAGMNDRLAENYLASLEPSAVTTHVRELLMQLLPSGGATQERVASRLNRSCSSLQRDLRSEGTSFRDVREDTRQRLAKGYVQNSDISLQEVAFLLGFSDQSNFSRAFRRWTGKSPKDWRESMHAGAGS